MMDPVNEEGEHMEEGLEPDEEEPDYIGEFSSDYINAEMFKAFDVDGSGTIDQEDLTLVGKAMGWNQK